MLSRLVRIRCGSDGVEPPLVVVVIVFLILAEYDGGVDMTRPSFRGGMRCPTDTVAAVDIVCDAAAVTGVGGRIECRGDNEDEVKVGCALNS